MKKQITQTTRKFIPLLLIAVALVLCGAPAVRAENNNNNNSDNQALDSKTLARVFHDTYWRWFYGNTTLPTDENGHAVLSGIALMPLPNAPGDGTPGSIDITLRGGQSFFLPLFGELGTSYTDGTPPDPFLDLNIFRTLAIKFTIDGKTIVDSKNVMDYFAQGDLVPPMPINSGGIDSLIWFQSVGVLRGPLSPGKHVLKLDVKNTIPAFGAIGEFHNTFNITVSPRVIPQTERFHGRTYAELSAKWWQWALEFPVDQPNRPHPFVDSPQFDVRNGQSGDVWFLAEPFGTSERTITVPDDKALFFPMVNVEASSLEAAPFFGATEAAQRAAAKLFADHIVNAFCTIDGVAVGPRNSYRVSSPQFSFNAPTPWINSPAPSGKGKAVGDGYYVLVEGLSKGDHTLHFGGAFHFNAGEVPEFGPDPVDFGYDTTYHVRVR